MDELNLPPLDWNVEWFRWNGMRPPGVYAHWCEEWDYLPIDEHCPEFFCCSCYEASDPVFMNHVEYWNDQWSVNYFTRSEDLLDNEDTAS